MTGQLRGGVGSAVPSRGMDAGSSPIDEPPENATRPDPEGLTVGRVPAIAFDPHIAGRAVLGTLGQGFWVVDGIG